VTYPFDFTTHYGGEKVRIAGSVSPGDPGKGPSMENAGGEPPTPPEVEDFQAFRLVDGPDGKPVEQEIEDFSVLDKMQSEMEDEIYEWLSERAYDAMRDHD